MKPFSQLCRRRLLQRPSLQHKISSRFKVTAAYDNLIRVENPYTGDIHCEVEKTTYDEFNDALNASVKSQQEWWEDIGKTMGLVERQRICLQFLDDFEKNASNIAHDISSMMGKPLQQSRNEINGVRERAEAMTDMATQFLSDQPVPPKIGYERKIRKDPLGTILIIAPWNYPLLCTINSLIPAILAGNSVILKLSSKTPTISNHFIDALEKAGCPRGLVTALNCDHATTEQIIKDERISGVVFTGSVAGGYQIQNATSNKFIDATLELGGKDPVYVRQDADLKHAVGSIVDGAMYNAGQSCCAVERVYVDSSIYNDFVDMSAELISNNYVLGDPLFENRDNDINLALTTTMGPMAQKSSINFLENQVKDAVAKGATLVSGNGKGCTDSAGNGTFFAPTILKDCNHTMNVMKDESFGPILPIQSVDSDNEAIELMNDSNYGLTAAVYTKDKYAVDRLFSHKIKTGTLFMNRCDYLDPFLPWTGVKQTGKGVSLSPYGFNNFTKLKSLHYQLKT